MYRVNLIYAPLAQLVEQLTLNQWVLGSSPRWCTKKALRKRRAFFIMIAALCECFHLPLTSTQVGGSFCFVGEMQELLL